MRYFIFLIFLFSLMASAHSQEVCEQHALDLASSLDARVLSIKAFSTECHIKLLISVEGEPPRQKTFVVEK